MKSFWKTAVFFLCFCLATIAGCGGSKMPVQADLMHRHFMLESVDGQLFTVQQRMPDITFGEGFRVYGQVCNRYTGQGELAEGILVVRHMASTKMFCADAALNVLEDQFARMLAAGVALDFSGDTLTLRQGGHVLVYRLQDKVK